MTPTDYENLVAEIAGSIRTPTNELNSLVIGSGCPKKPNRIEGHSGYSHQIDVSLLDGNRTFLIECKRWHKKVGLQEVLVLASRARDIHNMHPEKSIKAILVSTQGASKNAMKVARFFDIDIEIVKSATEFGLRIGRHVHVGVQSTARVGSSAEAEIVKKVVIVE